MIRVLILAMALAGWSALAPSPAAAQSGTITVRGSGVVEVQPDIAEIVIGVNVERATAAEAIDANSEAMQRVVADAKRAGVEARDIQTSILNLFPVREKAEALRFRAVNTARIRVRDLARLGAVTRGLIGSGANEMRGLHFSVADPKPHLDRARREAVEDARRRAEVLAGAAGRRLDDIIEIVEPPDEGPEPIPSRMAMQRADNIPTEPGALSLRTSVQIKWRLGP
jgi:uncharacterized protein YggE